MTTRTNCARTLRAYSNGRKLRRGHDVPARPAGYLSGERNATAVAGTVRRAGGVAATEGGPPCWC